MNYQKNDVLTVKIEDMGHDGAAGASAVAAARAELSAEACASYATSPMVPKEMFAT